MEYKMLQKQEDVLQNPTSRKWGKLEAVTNFSFLRSKIIALSNCSYDMKRLLLLEEKLWQI